MGYQPVIWTPACETLVPHSWRKQWLLCQFQKGGGWTAWWSRWLRGRWSWGSCWMIPIQTLSSCGQYLVLRWLRCNPVEYSFPLSVARSLLWTLSHQYWVGKLRSCGQGFLSRIVHWGPKESHVMQYEVRLMDVFCGEWKQGSCLGLYWFHWWKSF